MLECQFHLQWTQRRCWGSNEQQQPCCPGSDPASSSTHSCPFQDVSTGSRKHHGAWGGSCQQRPTAKTPQYYIILHNVVFSVPTICHIWCSFSWSLTLWFFMAPWSMARWVNSRRTQHWAVGSCLSGASDLWWASPSMCPVRVRSLTLHTHTHTHKEER